MSERIEQVVYKKDVPGTTLFLDGPSEFLVASVVNELALVPQWKTLFGEFIDGYKRSDYGMRNLPALRVYNDEYVKEFDSWFIEGSLKMDLLWPASLRRNEMQQYQDSVSAALLQQFRRPKFFDAVSLSVPGLNELGKRFAVDKTLGYFVPESSDPIPVTQITFNFRIDLRQWDLYLEQSLRTKDDPFEETLGSLQRIVTTIAGLRDSGDTEVQVDSDQKIK